jgi:energy-coupling factor transporter ATP-binding protein EcfA2
MSITTSSGKTVPEFRWQTGAFLDYTTVLYGASRSGKSTIIKNIMKILQSHIDQVIVISPTEISNHAYEGLVDSTLIHDKLYLADPQGKAKDNTPEKCAIRFLDRVFSRQQLLADMYYRASDIETLESLFRRLPSSAKEQIRRYSELSDKKKQTIINLINHQHAFDAGVRESKIEEVKKKFKDILLKIHKKHFKDNVKHLLKQNLTEDEKYTLNYIDINPRLLIIFDDCAADLKKIFKTESMRKYFYQGRHNFITMLLSVQNDKDIPPPLRANTFVSIYTDLKNCLVSFEDKTSHTKEVREFVQEAAKQIFTDSTIKHRKFVYYRDDPAGQEFYWIKAQHPLKTFHFGSDALRELCNMVRENSKKLDQNNPYYQHYALS